jgi:hypothetical protein
VVSLLAPTLMPPGWPPSSRQPLLGESLDDSDSDWSRSSLQGKVLEQFCPGCLNHDIEP